MAAVPIVTYGGSVESPTFSPDGDRIAFAWKGKARDNLDIYVRLIGTGEPQRLTKDPAADRAPACSPDGRFIAFLRLARVSGTYLYGEDVCVVPALDGTERRVAQVELPRYHWFLAWSPDGKWLVATDRNGEAGLYGLHLISVETGEKRRLTSPPPQRAVLRGDGMASFSPDGRSLVFVRTLAFDDRDIYRITLTGDYWPDGEPERLTYENRDIRSPVWARNGSQILYSSGSFWSGGRVVRRLDLRGPKGSGGYRTVQELFGEDAWELTVSAGGHRLAYHRGYSDTNIYRIELRDKDGRVGAPQNLIASTRYDMIPAFSPDGKTIAFTSARSRSEEIWLCHADGANARQLTFIGNPMVTNSRWSPDGKTILLQSRKGDTMGLYLVLADGGAPRRLTSGPAGEYEGSWSRDGTSVYFWSDRTGRPEVYKMPATGGEATRVTRDGGAAPLESPDGKWLYYSKLVADRWTIWRVPPSGGVERQVEPGPIGGHELDFAVVDDGIYFAKVGGTLEFFDFKSGRSRTVCRVEKPVALAEGTHVIGRDPAATLWIDSALVSRHHARIVVRGGVVTNEDLGSRNGTFVNGVRVIAVTSLAHGDEVRIGTLPLSVHIPSGRTATLPGEGTG